MTEHDNRDIALRALLRATAPEPPADSVDWAALHTRIEARARPLLRRAPRIATWQLLARWSPRAVPMTAVAAAAVVLLIVSGVIAPRATPARALDAAVTASFVTVEEALTYGTTDDARAILIAGIDDNEMLDAVLFYQEEQ